jgi:hypothetical protein
MYLKPCPNLPAVGVEAEVEGVAVHVRVLDVLVHAHVPVGEGNHKRCNDFNLCASPSTASDSTSSVA